MEKLRIIVGGFIGCFPAGGVTWDYMQYPLGFSLMGHEVYYIEDTRLYPVYHKEGVNWKDCSSTVEHLNAIMDYFGFKNHWAYRDEASGKYFGLSESAFKEICTTADIFINLSCSTYMREEYKRIPKRILIDTDPMFTQIQYGSKQMFTPGEPGLEQMIQDHNYLFTFGENIGSEDCLIPTHGLKWNTTRQPLCMNQWTVKQQSQQATIMFGTVMNWTAGKKLFYNDQEWGQKDVEFEKIKKLPQQFSDVQFSMVMNKINDAEGDRQRITIEKLGWKLLSPEDVANDWLSYRQFIEQSFGEFSVAKETYVKANTGWFSCRSACYLASGRPVITQETGWSKFIPSGNGLFAFQTLDEAVEAVKTVVKNKSHHINAARAIAEEYFESGKVLSHLLQKVAK